jgi:hypothetical protein
MRVDVELDSRNVLSALPPEMRMDLVCEPERGDGVMENGLRHTEVVEGPDCHVATDSRQTIKVENSHGYFQAET